MLRLLLIDGGRGRSAEDYIKAAQTDMDNFTDRYADLSKQYLANVEDATASILSINDQVSDSLDDMVELAGSYVALSEEAFIAAITGTIDASRLDAKVTFLDARNSHMEQFTDQISGILNSKKEMSLEETKMKISILMLDEVLRVKSAQNESSLKDLQMKKINAFRDYRGNADALMAQAELAEINSSLERQRIDVELSWLKTAVESSKGSRLFEEAEAALSDMDYGTNQLVKDIWELSRNNDAAAFSAAAAQIDAYGVTDATAGLASASRLKAALEDLATATSYLVAEPRDPIDIGTREDYIVSPSCEARVRQRISSSQLRVDRVISVMSSVGSDVALSLD